MIYETGFAVVLSDEVSHIAVDMCAEEQLAQLCLVL